MFTRKVLVSALIVAAAIAGFWMRKLYDEFIYSPIGPAFENQKQMSIDVLKKDKRINFDGAFASDLAIMKIDYVIMRYSYCTIFTPPNGVYWHSINVCFDKKSSNADVYIY